MYRFTDNEEMPTIHTLQKPAKPSSGSKVQDDYLDAYNKLLSVSHDPVAWNKQHQRVKALRNQARAHVRPSPVKIKNTIQPQSSGINYRNQPRDRRGRWTKILDGIKSIPKRYKKLKRNLSPKYHMKRVQRTRRQFQRIDLSQQWGIPITGKPTKQRRKRR